MSQPPGGSSPPQERALLCGVLREVPELDLEEPLEELARLAETAGAHVVGRIWQRRSLPDPATYLGRGKVEELAIHLRARDGNLVICDDDLSPAQGRKLERALGGVRVIDRSQLILDIFARHARSRQARLQVELAQLEYTLPRLKRMWTHLERLGGGIGTRGPGETQIETDRRLIRRKIADHVRSLRTIRDRKEREVAARERFFTVGLVGYTNAGKSTLHRALTGSQVDVADRLFATLDTKTSLLVLPDRAELLLSDTVGFIHKLPHHLVACFHATLAEARAADLLLHVVDSSHPKAEDHVAVVEEVLADLGLDQVPTILVLNKSDLVREPLSLSLLEVGDRETVRVSALRRQGLGELLERVRIHHQAGFLHLEVRLPAGEGRLLAWLERHAQVQERDYGAGETEVLLVARMSRGVLGALCREHPGLQWRELDSREGATAGS